MSESPTPAPRRAVVTVKPRRLPGDRGKPPMLALTWSSFFGSGYFPVAPGTAGTAAAVPLFFLLTRLFTGRPIFDAVVYGIITAIVTGTGILAADRAGKYYGVADSGHIVIDEVAGYLVTMFMLPWDWRLALIGFVWFRICDVLKPWPARFFDRDPRWKNGAGVVLDDIFAAVWAALLTRGTWELLARVHAI
jgi:phosphatidylglycerophosphatase A